jgi:hypothetical protein
MRHGNKKRAMSHHGAQPNTDPGNPFHHNVYVNGAAEGVVFQGEDSEDIISRGFMFK